MRAKDHESKSKQDQMLMQIDSQIGAGEGGIKSKTQGGRQRRRANTDDDRLLQDYLTRESQMFEPKTLTREDSSDQMVIDED